MSIYGQPCAAGKDDSSHPAMLADIAVSFDILQASLTAKRNVRSRSNPRETGRFVDCKGLL